jgi:quercetin 2,3-dioxygenase
MPPAASAETVRVLYVFDGDGLEVGGSAVGGSTGAVVRADRAVELVAPGRAELLVLQGRPIAEPVARYGPFVMNTDAEIRQAFADYQRTQFGGWPWPADDPVHGRDGARFARHADGRVEQAALA